MSSALATERAYLDEFADLIHALDDPRAIPASLVVRMGAAARRVDELVAREAAILDELAGHSARGIAATVPVRVYCGDTPRN